MEYIVDEIIDGIVRCEVNETFIELPLCTLPEAIKEGDIVKCTNDGFVLLEKETEQRTLSIWEKFNRLKNEDDEL